nr:uncharacterized protein LOC111506091 [Leptinotarsa decemlineata]
MNINKIWVPLLKVTQPDTKPGTESPTKEGYSGNAILGQQHFPYPFKEATVGFRSEHSTELQVLRVVDYATSFNLGKEYHTGEIFLEVSKAFERVLHDGLRAKLNNFGYSKQMKTLLTIKHVNSYWSYVVQEILKERKTREKINKYLETLEAKIDPKKLESSLKSSEKPSYKTPKRLHNIYYELGAIPKKIVPTQKKNLVDTCLISEATKELEDEFALHTGELVSFPRLIKQDIQLYRHLPCFLQDVNVRYDDGSDIQRQRSILTYSLTSIMSTLKICVNEQDLSDW